MFPTDYLKVNYPFSPVATPASLPLKSYFQRIKRPIHILHILLIAMACATSANICHADAAQLQGRAAIDSLMRLAASGISDSVRAFVFQQLSIEYNVVDEDSSQKYIRKAIALAHRRGLRSEAAHIAELGRKFMILREFDSALYHLRRSYQIAAGMRNKDWNAFLDIHRALGAVYWMLNQVDSASHYNFTALELIDTHVPNLPQKFLYLGNLGNMFSSTRNYETALKYFQLALASAKEKNQPPFTMLVFLANTYYNLENYDKAVATADEAIESTRSGWVKPFEDPKYYYAAALAVKARSLQALDADAEADRLFKESMAILNVSYRNSYYRCISFEGLATQSMKRNQFIEAKGYAEQARRLAIESRSAAELPNVLKQLAYIEYRLGNLDKARAYDAEFTSALNVLIEKGQRIRVNDLQIKLMQEQKELEKRVLIKEKELQRATINQQRLYISIISVSLFALLVVVFIVYRLFLIKKRTSAELAERNSYIEMQKEEIEAQNNNLQSTLQQLERTQEQLVHAEKMASLAKLTAGIAHEMNNSANFTHNGIEEIQESIAGINAVLNRLAETDPHGPELPEKLQAIQTEMPSAKKMRELNQMFDIIKLGVVRITEIVRSLQRFSYSKIGTVREMNMNDALNDTIARLRSHGDAKKIHIIRNFAVDPPVVECDPSEIQQVFYNLLLNAMQAIASEGTIEVTTKTNVNDVTIYFKDNGKGIPHNIQSKIFDPFFTTKDVGQGTGLGLAISHNIIKNHHGEIHLVSAPGSGSEFIITLPRRHKSAANGTVVARGGRS